MKVLLLGATGMIGSRIAAEAVARRHEVTAATRSGGADDLPVTEALTVATVDANDPFATARLVAGHDVVVSAVSPPRDGSDPAPHLLSLYRSLLQALRTAGVPRVLVVGGAGSLRAASGVDRVEEPDFPTIHRAESLAQREVLRLLRAEADDLEWTYVSPADTIAPGTRTGDHRTGGDEMFYAADGTSPVSAEDDAAALVDELERGAAVRRRITVAS